MSAAAAVAIDPPEERAKRAAVAVDHKRAPRDDEFEWALDLVDGLGETFHRALSNAVGEGRGRPGSITARHVLVAWALLVTENEHKAEVTDAAAQLGALSKQQLDALGMQKLPVERAYKRFHGKFTRVRRAFSDGFSFDGPNGTVEVGLDWWTSAAPQQAIPSDLPSSSTRAVDGTDWESAGRFRANATAEYDGDAPVDTDTDPDEHHTAVTKTRRRVAKAAKWEIGADGRAIHTTDRDARAGYRTATAGRKGGHVHRKRGPPGRPGRRLQLERRRHARQRGTRGPRLRHWCRHGCGG